MNPDGAEHWRLALHDYVQREARPVEKFGHQPRLYALATRIGGSLPADVLYDDDVVYAAAWLHDLGVFHGHRPEEPRALEAWDNVRYAMERAPAILADLGFPSEKVGAVVEAIRTHQAAAVPMSTEAAILRDADILEQLGAIGILRAVCKVGRDTRYRTFSEVIPVLRDAFESLPGVLHYGASRELARDRVAVLRAFLDGVEKESAGPLF